MKCIVHFYADWLDFRLAEFDALLRLFGVQPSTAYDQQNCPLSNQQHFMFVELPNDNVAKSICNRAVLVKSIQEYWGHGFGLAEVEANVQLLPESFLGPFFQAENSWSVQVESFGKSLNMKQKQDYRVHFKFLRFQGPVDIKNAKVELWLTLDFSLCSLTWGEGGTEENPLVPIYFGRSLGWGGMKKERIKYDLKNRLYLGPTSLDDSLALMLSNMCGVRKGTIAYDPFVGTASILVALSHFGAFCVGSDIDPRVLRGEMYAGPVDRSKDTTKRDIIENFKAYGLQVPELVRMDNHALDRHCYFGSANSVYAGMFDVIVTDPPYGIRAGARKSGKAKPVTYNIDDNDRSTHVPSTQNYPVEEVMLDLMHTAAKVLVTGGMLAYLIPTPYDFTISDLPTHPCLEIVNICHQGLTTRHGRRAVIMRKHSEYTAEHKEAYQEYKQKVMSGQDAGFGQLMTKLKAALAADAFENDAVIKQSSILAQKRKVSKDFRKKQREEGIIHPPKKQLDKTKTIPAGEGDAAVSEK